VLDALWDLVWAGEVTNDTFAPLRALRWKRPARSSGRPRPGRLTTLGPPEAAGRWSLVRPDGTSPGLTSTPNGEDAGTDGPGLGAPGRAGNARRAGDLQTAPRPAAATERLHATALALLDRHGVLVREAVMAEGIEGGFAAVYPVLRALEEAGRIRRGYFIEGLGAAQFALPGAIDRLRAARATPPDGDKTPAVHLLAAADPANPYGAALPWPRRGEGDRRPLQRAAGAIVVLVDGIATLYVERGGHALQTLPAFDDPGSAGLALAALRGLVGPGRERELVVSRIDALPVAESPHRAALLAAGFVAAYRGLTLRGA
jgi:ATP-dependent Lhr-like helicase